VDEEKVDFLGFEDGLAMISPLLRVFAQTGLQNYGCSQGYKCLRAANFSFCRQNLN
jgi:hypothetical protein